MTANCADGRIGFSDLRSVGKDSDGHRRARGSVTAAINRLTPIVYLQKNWDSLEDMDLVNRIFKLNGAGVPLGRLAAALNCSEDLLHHLLKVANLVPVDWAFVRRVETRARKLARPPARRTGMQKKAAVLEKARSAEVWSAEISRWLLHEGFSSGYAWQVIAEARSLLRKAEGTGNFPPGQAPADMPTKEIILRVRPSDLNPSEGSLIAAYGFWLALWTYHAIPRSAVRDQALNLAWEIAASCR